MAPRDILCLCISFILSMNLFYLRYIKRQGYQGKLKMACDNRRIYDSMTKCGLILVKFDKSVISMQKSLKGEIKRFCFCTISKIPIDKKKQREKD